MTVLCSKQHTGPGTYWGLAVHNAGKQALRLMLSIVANEANNCRAQLAHTVRRWEVKTDVRHIVYYVAKGNYHK